MGDEIDEMMEHLNGHNVEEAVAVYVGEPFSTNWIYVRKEVAEKITAVLESNRIEK